MAPSYDTPDVFSTTSPSSTIGASLSTTPTIQSPVSDRSFDSHAPSPRPYYMPRKTDSPSQIFESSDEATQDHTYAQKTDETSPSLPEATSDIIHATLTETCVDNVQGKPVVQLSDAMPLQHTASTLLLDETETLIRDATSTSTYELLDETSAQGATNKQLPEATVTSMHELPDETVP